MTGVFAVEQAVEIQMAELAPLLAPTPVSHADDVAARTPPGVRSSGEVLWQIVWQGADPDGWGAGSALEGDPSRVRARGLIQIDVMCLPSAARTAPYRVYDVVRTELEFERIDRMRVRVPQPPTKAPRGQSGLSRYQITVPFYVLDL